MQHLKDKKNIYLVITPDFPTKDYWRFPFIFDQVCALQRALPHMEVIVFSLHEEHAPKDYVYQGVRVLGGDNHYVGYPGAGWFPWLPLYLNSKRFIKALKKRGLDFNKVLIIHQHFMGIESVRTYGMKQYFPNACHLIQCHFLEPLNVCHLGYLKTKLRFLFIRHLFETADIIISISNSVTRFLKTFPYTTTYPYVPNLNKCQRILKHFNPIKPKRIELLHNGVDIRQFNSNGRKPHQGFHIGCVANFWKIKDQLSLLQALTTIKNKIGDWKLRFIGSGPFLEICKCYVQEHKLEKNVTFESEIDHANLPAFYRSLDLFVLPSYAEAFGCVFTEAYACGTPFITCKGQGMDDFIYEEDRDLWLCNPKDPKDLADKILTFYQQRPQQRLSSLIDIDTLIIQFIKHLNISSSLLN